MATARDMKTGHRKYDHRGAAEYLGVDEGTLYNWVAERKITVIKMGRKNVYRERDLEDYIERRERPADKIAGR